LLLVFRKLFLRHSPPFPDLAQFCANFSTGQYSHSSPHLLRADYIHHDDLYIKPSFIFKDQPQYGGVDYGLGSFLDLRLAFAGEVVSVEKFEQKSKWLIIAPVNPLDKVALHCYL
jgi:hypothetical protein